MKSYLVRQSDLQSWAYCPQRFRLERLGVRESGNSAAAFGTVMHHALHYYERTRDLDGALRTFFYYWHPLHLEELAEPVPRDGWLPNHSYGELRERGERIIREYAEFMRFDEHEVLALEYQFVVPVVGTPHYLTGTVDRLSVRWHKRKEIVSIDDLKSGRQKWNLRHNVQGHAYAYASTRPEFWLGGQATARRPFIDDEVQQVCEGFGQERGLELALRFEDAPRRFNWINLTDGKQVDGGPRGGLDYQRLAIAVSQIAASFDAGIYPLSITGDTCTYCPFRHSCGGVGIADEAYDSTIGG